MAGRNPYVPWHRDTLKRHAECLSELLKNSLYPATPEEAFDHPTLNAAYHSLSGYTGCKICRLLCRLVSVFDPPQAFFEDYSLLCLACLYAPITWSAALMAAADLREILTRYFPQSRLLAEECSYNTHSGILGPDIQLHFFLHRCFKRQTDSSKAYLQANLCFLKMEFLRANITGKMTSQLCFKTFWNHLCRRETTTAAVVAPPPLPLLPSVAREDLEAAAKTAPRCCPAGGLQSAEAIEPNRGESKSGSSPLVQEDPSQHPMRLLKNEDSEEKPAFLDCFIEVWKETDLLARRINVLRPPVETESAPPLAQVGGDDDDRSQGPCLLAPTFTLKSKNHTFSVCLLCEATACHPEGRYAVDIIHEEVIGCTHNNMKLLDRITYVMASPDFLNGIRDANLRTFVGACSAQEVFKHLFGDPLCLLNHRSANPRMLFKTLRDELTPEQKQNLVLGEYLKDNQQFDCEYFLTLAIVFKGLQHFKVSKTTFLEILRELDVQLSAHGIRAVQSIQIAHLYS